MEEKSIVPNAGRYPTFIYKEDYLLFAMLVRHGLADPDDYASLVEAQRRTPEKPALLSLLAAGSELPPKALKDMQSLLDILAEPRLRDLLPSELPQIKTIVDRTSADTLQEAAPRRKGSSETALLEPRAKPSGDAETVVDGGSIVANTLDSLSGTHLSQDEIERVNKARAKSHLVGEILAGHVILDRLGSGGQGDVYLAKQLSLNRYVALKKLEIPSHADHQAFIEAFRQEAQTLGAINHARIVKVYEIFQQNGAVFFTMEYLNGKTLRDLVVDAKGPLPVEVVANLACQACSALGRTAADGLVHRDIKPANMMVDENGDLKIVDFGLAGLTANFAGDGQNQFAGTPQFAAPEQCSGGALTPASDQYSLGLTLYYVLTGEAPVKGKKLQDILQTQINETPNPPSSINTELPSSIDRVIMRMIEKDPAKRYSSFDDCFGDWERILTESGRGKLAGASQLLGESLLRFTKAEKNQVAMQSAALFFAWLALAYGTMHAEFPLRRAGLIWVLSQSGTWGTYLLVFSLSCIFYVAAARRHYLPIWGSLRVWLYTHIVTAVISVVLLMIHSGNFLFGIMPGPPQAKPILSLLMASVLLITAISGSVGLLIFRGLRRTLQIQQLALRGTALSPREQMMTVLSAELLSGWRLVHYPLAIFFILLTVLHIIQTMRYTFG